MTHYLLVFVGGLLFSAGLILLKSPFFAFALRTTALLNAILNTSLGEDARQKNLIRNLAPLLKSMAIFLLLLIVVIAVAVLPALLHIHLSGTDATAVDTGSVRFYLSMAAGSVVPFLIPTAKKDSDYSDWSKLLHRMFLDNQHISKALFFIDRRLNRGKLNTQDESFVVVTGLARAGTTALTNLLYSTRRFHSLSYANMPFLLSVNLWRKLYRPRTDALKQRAHGDRVLFGHSTIEALEEYFFKVFLNDRFIGENALSEHVIDPETNTYYADYRKLIGTGAGDTTYIAKNNNLILRHASLSELNPGLKTILIFRNPVDHAFSLLSQHRRFSQLHQSDPFTLEYMDWLGHHEFGLNHRPFDLGGECLHTGYKPDSIDYWVAIWIEYYAHVLTLGTRENLIPVNYADLLNSPDALLTALGERLKTDLHVGGTEAFKKSERPDVGVDAELLRRATAIHEQLIVNTVM